MLSKCTMRKKRISQWQQVNVSCDYVYLGWHWKREQMSCFKVPRLQGRITCMGFRNSNTCGTILHFQPYSYRRIVLLLLLLLC